MSKTSHQLARELLAAPDFPVYIYEDRGDEPPIGHSVRMTFIEGFDEHGDSCEVVELFGKHSVASDIDRAP